MSYDIKSQTVITGIDSKKLVVGGEFTNGRFMLPLDDKSRICFRTDTTNAARLRLVKPAILTGSSFDITTANLNQIIYGDFEESVRKLLVSQICACAGNYIIFDKGTQLNCITHGLLEGMGYIVRDVRFSHWDSIMNYDKDEPWRYVSKSQSASFYHDMDETFMPRVMAYDRFAIFIGYDEPEDKQKFSCFCSHVLHYIMEKYLVDYRFKDFTNIISADSTVMIDELDAFLPTAWNRNSRFIVTEDETHRLYQRYGAIGDADMRERSCIKTIFDTPLRIENKINDFVGYYEGEKLSIK